jgi:NAD(P)-dependent dehydrogenase (short-subunit alcohol dehydrogenase family)
MTSLHENDGSGDLISFARRTILVTGASSGIGRETSILLGRLGARLVLVGRDRVRLEATARLLEGDGHSIESFDLSDTDAIPDWIQSIGRDRGPLDGLVHAAGVHAMSPLRSLTSGEVESIMRTNLGSALALAKGFRKRKVSSPGSNIVFLSSVAALTGQPGVAAYSASKGAIAAATRALAIELAPEGIRVNCVAPGMVQTEMAERIRASMLPEQWEAIAQMHPLGLGQPLDVAYAIAFLLSTAARWITGVTLVVDGGYSAR